MQEDPRLEVGCFFWVKCVYVSIVCTSFGVSGTWINLMFVCGFTVSVDPPGLAECLRTRLHQSRSRQEVIALVAIEVTAETTGPPRPLRSQLGWWTELSISICSSFHTCIITKGL